jgi:Domain of unknown function (DUF5658)
LLRKFLELNKNSRLFYFLLTSLVALVVADGIITRFLVINNLGTELNPFLQTWVESDTLLLLKLAGSAIAAFMLWRVSKKYPRLTLIVTISCIVFYMFIIIWNLYVFFKVQS